MKKTVELLEILKTSGQVNLSSWDTLTFQQYLCRLMERANLTPAALIAKSGLSRTYAYQIFDGSRTPGKAKVLLLALAMHLDLEETNRLLTLSQNPTLYARIPADAIVISGIFHNRTILEINESLYEAGFEPLS